MFPKTYVVSRPPLSRRCPDAAVRGGRGVEGPEADADPPPPGTQIISIIDLIKPTSFENFKEVYLIQECVFNKNTVLKQGC